VGRSQLPFLAAVLENGRLSIEVAFDGTNLLDNEWVLRGRKGFEAIESFSNRAAKLKIFRGFMLVVNRLVCR
jgi:hypothetical protein